MFNDFYTVYKWLENHPIFQEKIQFEDKEWNESHFISCLYIEVVKVNPVNNSIEDDDQKNTKVQIWLECGQYDKECKWHDVELDCGADTFEEAIIKLANLIMEWYGETKDRIKKSSWED